MFDIKNRKIVGKRMRRENKFSDVDGLLFVMFKEGQENMEMYLKAHATGERLDF